MERVKGLGGLFFKSRDPAALSEWYRERLGMEIDEHRIAQLRWRRDDESALRETTVWSPFKADTKYFEPSTATFMMNFIVDDLDAMLAQLRAAGATVDAKVDESEYGKFGWVMDPDGNRIELWQPPRGK